MSSEPLCFVLMPFGTKDDPSGRPKIRFDDIYGESIRPAIEAAGMAAIRADEERVGGIIHKPMFERLMLCEYAVADLTTANANVFYELGVRHTARPRTTVAIFAEHQPIPFDLQFLQAIPYDLGADNAFGKDEAEKLRSSLQRHLEELRKARRKGAPTDSPVFQLLRGWREPDLTVLEAEAFHEQVARVEELRASLSRAGDLPAERAGAALEEIERDMGDIDHVEPGIILDLMLSYRKIEAWTAMIDLADRMPGHLARQVVVREQLALALNKRAQQRKKDPVENDSGATDDWRRAQQLLMAVEDEQGPNPETCGLLGAVYKLRWKNAGNAAEGRGFLRQAIEAYVRGFEADWRDYYPGINAVTLLDIRGDEESCQRRDRLLPVVRFSTEQSLKGTKPGYWDHATMLELAVLAGDSQSAREHLDLAVSQDCGSFERNSTAGNLRQIAETRRARGEDPGWIEDLVADLTPAHEEVQQ